MDYKYLSEEQKRELEAQRIWNYEKDHYDRTLLIEELKFNNQDSSGEEAINKSLEAIISYLRGENVAENTLSPIKPTDEGVDNKEAL